MGYKPLHGHIEPISRFRVPFFVPLVEEERYQWVDDFIEEQHTKAGIQYLRQQKKAFLELPPVVSDLRLKLEKSHDAYLDRIADRIINFCLRGQNALDPFGRLERRPEMFQYVGFEVVERVLAKIETDTDLIFQASGEDPRITESDRQKELEEIQNALDEKRAALAELTKKNQAFFLLDQAKIGQDAREALISHWRSVQRWTNGPCSPRGISLEHSFPEEISAYEKLEIGKSMLPKATLLPYPEPVI